ncbi:MAG: hypothetical protein V1922_03570 [bacterium]
MNSIQFKQIFPNTLVARYNLAVWQQSSQDSLFFIGREVAHAAVTGEPDNGILKLFEIGKDGDLIQEKTIWKPIFDGINLEDPRALKLKNENLIIGLTAVLRNKRGVPLPFPALVRIDSLNTWKKELPPVLIIDTFGPGKNLTPIDSHSFLFRPDMEAYNYKLLVFSLHSQIPEKIADINFPINLPWATLKIGTTMPPLWITPTEALFIIHGISLKYIEGKEKFVYSIGRAKLTRKNNKYSVVVVQKPILTPDDFLGINGLPFIEELHPELRRVVYSCGGVIRKQSPDKLSLYVNVGDRTTVEVTFLLSELKDGLFPK